MGRHLSQGSGFGPGARGSGTGFGVLTLQREPGRDTAAYPLADVRDFHSTVIPAMPWLWRQAVRRVLIPAFPNLFLDLCQSLALRHQLFKTQAEDTLPNSGRDTQSAFG